MTLQGKVWGSLRVLASGESASILIFHFPPATLYVTLAWTVPIMPSDELDASVMEKVMESADTAATFQVRNDQLLVPLCSVLAPSFCSVLKTLPSIL